MNHPTVENLELVIEAVAIPCEGKLHAHGVGGHNPLQLAAAGISWGCPHCASELTTLIICAGRLDQLTGDAANGERVGCDDCGRSAALAEFIRQIIPLTSH